MIARTPGRYSAARAFDRDPGQPGQWCVSDAIAGPTTYTVAAGVARWARWVPTRAINLVALGFMVSTAGNTAADPIELMIYDALTNGLVATTGAVKELLNSTGTKRVALAEAHALAAGHPYYVGAGFATVAATAAIITGFSMGFQGAMFNANRGSAAGGEPGAFQKSSGFTTAAESVSTLLTSYVGSGPVVAALEF
jgi:hypothetical protein